MSASALRQAVGIPTSALAKDFVLPGPSGGTMPKLLYGTAWKEKRTADLVYLAIKTGFRGIDTAAQPRHYQEELVGEGIRRALSEGLVSRRDLYIQTKFTPFHGQDPHRIPYNPADAIPEQVHASVASSLRNLATTTPSEADTDAEEEEAEPYLDTLLLHTPYDSETDTLAAWQTLATYVPRRIRRLGISNATPAEVQALLDATASRPEHRPVLAQNTFLRVGGFRGLRTTTGGDGGGIETGTGTGTLVFQSFHTLALAQLKRRPAVLELARAADVEPVAAFYALVLGLGGTAVLDGTADEAHMRADLEGVEKLGRWVEAGGQGTELWGRALGELARLVRDG